VAWLEHGRPEPALGRMARRRTRGASTGTDGPAELGGTQLVLLDTVVGRRTGSGHSVPSRAGAAEQALDSGQAGRRRRSGEERGPWTRIKVLTKSGTIQFDLLECVYDWTTTTRVASLGGGKARQRGNRRGLLVLC
jgi:hypothetical protein